MKFKDYFYYFCIKSNIYKIFPKKIKDKMKLKYEKVLYKKFDNHIDKLRKISNELKPITREDCFDRYYINDYVELNKKYIKGDVLEFAGGDVIYAKKYGDNPNVRIMCGLNHKEAYPNADYYADLDNTNTLPNQKFDCIVATQVIMYMNSPLQALKSLKYMLKPNGTLILTVPGPLFHHSKNSHHMLSFTEESLKYLCEKVFGNYENFKYYGDMECCQYMLFWMKKNPYRKPLNHEYSYTLVMGIMVHND